MILIKNAFLRVLIASRTSQMELGDKICFDGWTLDTRSGELVREGATTRLSEHPLRILVELASHAGEVVTREQLIQRLWPRGVVDFDAGLNTAMRKLRLALDDVGDSPRYIETLPRRGYRFIGQVEAIPPVAPVERAPVPTRRWAWIVAAIGLIAIAAAMLTLRLTSSDDVRPSKPSQVRIAIVPFENLSPDPAHAFFADGLHDQTLTALSQRAPDIEVISRTTMSTYKNHRPSAAELARSLGATHVLTGTVRRQENEVNLSVELIDARTDRHLWSWHFDRHLTDAMLLQSDVAAEVANQLSNHLEEATAQARTTRDVDAFDLYLKARQENISNFRAIDRTAVPVALLSQAIERDPEFAHAYAERAVANFLAFIGNWDVTQARLDAVKADIDAARRLAPNDPVIRALNAPYTAFKELAPERALEEVAEGVRLGNRDALEMQSLMLWSMGRPDESDAVCRRIIELDPLNESIRVRRVSVLFAARHWKEALAEADIIPPRARDLGEIVRFEIMGESPVIASIFGNVTTFSDLGREQRDPAVSLDTYLLYMRMNRRFGQAQQFLRDFPLQTVRSATNSAGALPGLGSRPVDEHRAWLALLAGKPEQAARYAQGVRSFLRATTETAWNAWFLQMLAAEADLFEGNREAAASATRKVLAMAPSRAAHVRAYRYRERMAAAVFAWAGARDEAVTRLRSLAYDVPVIGAASVARDPLFAIPLADHAAYRDLQAALEAEIGSLKSPASR